MKRRGRPNKYKEILESLDPHTLYTPGSIAMFAQENEFIKNPRSEDVRLLKLRIRIAMGRFSNNHKFPNEGDGQVRRKGQRPTPGWFGWRWQKALREKKKGGKK